MGFPKLDTCRWGKDTQHASSSGRTLVANPQIMYQPGAGTGRRQMSEAETLIE